MLRWRVVRGFSSRELGGVDACSDASGRIASETAPQTRQGADGSLDELLARRDAPERSRRRNGDGGAHEGFDVAGHVARVRRRVRWAEGKAEGQREGEGKGAETRGREAANVGGSPAVYRYFVPVMETRVVSCCCLIVVETRAMRVLGGTDGGCENVSPRGSQSGTDEIITRRNLGVGRGARIARGEKLAALVRAPSASRQHRPPAPARS